MKQSITIGMALSAVLFFSAARVAAQKVHVVGDEQESYLSAHFGFGFPTGEFAKTNVYDEKAASAESGFSGSLKYTQMLSSRFGIGLAIHLNSNPLNTSELGLQLQSATGAEVSVSGDSWRAVSYMAGGEFREPLSSDSRSVFDMSLMIGYMSATSPPMHISILSTSSGFIDYPSNEAGAFAFLIGAGFHLSVSESISIPLTFNYLTGTPHFESFIVDTSNGPDVAEGYDQPIGIFNLTTGIEILLD